MDYKNLDKLFQEQLENLEATPNKRVWNNIESNLKKKKRRVLPFWWFASGIAAMLLLGMFLFPFSTKETDFINTDSNIIITEIPENEIKIIEKPKMDALIKKDINERKNLFAIKKTINNRKNTDQKKVNEQRLVSIKKAIKKTSIADNLIKKAVIFSENNISNKSISLDRKGKVVKNRVADKEKKSSKHKIDLNKFIEKKDSIFSVKPSGNRWSVAPVFAVLNSSSFSNSSPVNKSLANTTKGKSSFSYGFQVGYQINKKWSVRSGVHLQEMVFVNNQVTAVSSIASNSSPIAFNSGGSFSFNKADVQSLSSDNNSYLTRAYLDGDLSQKYGYIEIPIEIKYNLLGTKKFNAQVVAGFSSLFLNKNEVNFNTQFMSKSGKANNLNHINFSGNLGFDFNYSLNKKWSLNLSPMFKAQLNTFSKDSNGFSPFNLGAYSGVKYKF